MYVTFGRTRLREWFAADEKRTQADVAAALGAKPQAVSQWVRGTTRPGPNLRAALERYTGVQADAWLTKSDVARAQRADAKVTRALARGRRPPACPGAVVSR